MEMKQMESCQEIKREQLPQMAPEVLIQKLEEPAWYFCPAAQTCQGSESKEGDKIRLQS